MSELSERIRRNITPNLDGWLKRLLTEAADDIDRLELRVEALLQERDLAQGERIFSAGKTPT